MSSIPSQPGHLRLVGTDDPQAIDTWITKREARQAIIRENRLASNDASLDPTDPRWVMAAKAYASLQGSTLTPERRERLVHTAKSLGLRPFDANLVIAIVQDHARRGLRPDQAIGSLKMIEPVQRRHHQNMALWIRWGVAIACAVMANAFLIWWLTAGS
ncbi:MAG: hypothetical protein O7G85_10310 [Planctomycetota bacterium]|nr:hypothetical protein [Planctomycetota bacterium]